jgi:crotonobetainyl-CoA:carnitine CoA-transferase CaiB-like acyl-CoA transferase
VAVSPFAGISVLNAATGTAGAVAGHFLAMLGARVILVEPPEGSPLRRLGPFPGDVPDQERSGVFLHLARGQESVTLDRSLPAGRYLIAACARGAQLVVEDEGATDANELRAALLEQRNLGAASYSILSISPFGLTGPLATRCASDIVLFGLSGLMSSVGEPGEEPLQLPGWLLQAYVGLSAFPAATTAIWWQEHSGRPHDVDVAALDVLATSIPHAINRYSYTGAVLSRQGNRLLSGYPWTLLPCKDGYVGIIVLERNWDVFCLWMERPDLIDDPRFATRYVRSQHADELDEIMRPWALQHTKEELYREGQARQMPFGGVFTVEDILQRDREGGRAFLEWITRSGNSPLARAASPFLVNGQRLVPGEAPRLGEHTAVLLEELAGIDDARDFTHLRQEGVA